MNHLLSTCGFTLPLWVTPVLTVYHSESDLARNNQDLISFSLVWKLNVTTTDAWSTHTKVKSAEPRTKNTQKQHNILRCSLLSSPPSIQILLWEPTVVFLMLIPIRSQTFDFQCHSKNSTCVDIFIKIRSKRITGFIRPAGDSVYPNLNKNCVDRVSRQNIPIKSPGSVELLAILLMCGNKALYWAFKEKSGVHQYLVDYRRCSSSNHCYYHQGLYAWFFSIAALNGVWIIHQKRGEKDSDTQRHLRAVAVLACCADCCI